MQADSDAVEGAPAAEQGVAAFGGRAERGEQLVVAAVVGDIPPVDYEDTYYRQIAGLTEDQPAAPSLH